MKTTFIIIGCILFFFPLFWRGAGAEVSAQANSSGIIPSVSQNEDVQLLYRNEQEFGALAHSSGWGLNYRKCKHITGYRKRILEVEMAGMRHPKEIKLQVPDIGTKGYFYGKQFVVTVLRGGYGYHKVITGKSDRRGVELRLLTVAGPSIALAKPVYLNIWHQDPVNPPFGNITIEKYDPTNLLHTPNYIIGRAGYFRGFEQMNFYPGAFFKLGLSFEHSTLDDDIKLLETGIVIDAFYKTIPIMATARNNQVFVNVYLNVMFGKKWF
ncbi:MAG: hypothetical protein EPN85_10660 [Bacteroidetes bacterium]|nr:MAG: hypothetical protein EPN85_10660 [Bacteroidota bacterium]